MTTYITYDAGCNIWEVQKFNPSIDWHKSEFQGTYQECQERAKEEMEPSQPHYENASYQSIWDY